MRPDLPDISGYANSDDDKSKRKELIYDMYANKKYSWQKIYQLTRLSRSTVFHVRQELITEGKLEKNDRGHVVKSKQQRREEEFAALDSSDFVQRHECIKTLADAYRTTDNPKTHVTSMYVICKTINTPPESFLTSTKDAVRLYNDFVDKFQKGETVYLSKQKSKSPGSDTSHKRYNSSLRQFLRVNDRPLPPKIDGNLSGKKENYGAYSDVQLSDLQFQHGLKFFSEVDDGHNDEWKAWFAMSHDGFPRPKSMDNHILNLQPVQKSVDDMLLSYLADSVYESKTKKRFPKWIFRNESVDALRHIPNNKNILHHIQKSKLTQKSTELLKQFYADEKLIELDQKYRKVIDGEKYYLTTKPRHSLRHSGCHFMMRSSGNNAATVAMFGWDDLTMITQVYASISVDSILDEGSCNFCNPPKIKIPDSNLIFCSLRHAIAYHSNGCKTKEQMNL